jgi:hypothetical protein
MQAIERRIELGDLLFFKRKAVFFAFNISDVLTHGLVEPVLVEARPFTWREKDYSSLRAT